ncbi:MAG: class I SAM-dependent methyltransferase [Candidatus Theseobacter exili]|nr:class I SAM-dependent methyltransferase [Candidatus Theseobacter exili]
MNQDTYFSCERNDIISMIPESSIHILDIGCGFGEMGKKLKERRNVEIIGVEKDEKAAKRARNCLDDVISGDIEKLKLPYKEGYFDCIIYGDILEHLIDPWQIVKEHVYYLKNGGYCIASIPNISHYKIIQSLIKNRWDYLKAGILDKTHLRFFTKNSIYSLFYDAGYMIEETRDVLRASKVKKMINLILGRSVQYLFVEQYIIRGKIVETVKSD